MPTHFLAHWHHDNVADPIRIYEEVVEDRTELRKVEEFRDGRLVRADSVTNAATSLSWEPIPALDDIANQPEFSIEMITAEAFDAVWVRSEDAAR